MTPWFSIIIPGFNRSEPLKYTLQSAAVAAAQLPSGSVEIILVDDGSSPSLAEQLNGFDPGHPITHLRQKNQGSIVARLTGLASAHGQRVLFLDSDDLIAPEKLIRHHESGVHEQVDIVYDDMAKAELGSNYSSTFLPYYSLEDASSAPDLLLRIQPLPHVPTFDRAYLTKILADPMIAPDRKMDPSGDVWLYYNLVAFPATISKLHAALTAVGPHEEVRYSLHWEKLGVAALLITEAFQRTCPQNAATLEIRRQVGETAFSSWRRLPRDFHSGFAHRQLNLWRGSPRGPISALGGGIFGFAARLLGPVTAGRLYKRFFGRTYASCRTLDTTALTRLLAESGIH